MKLLLLLHPDSLLKANQQVEVRSTAVRKCQLKYTFGKLHITSGSTNAVTDALGKRATNHSNRSHSPARQVAARFAIGRTRTPTHQRYLGTPTLPRQTPDTQRSQPENQRMAKVLDEILESFYTNLSESDALPESTVEELRTLLAAEKKPKANDFVAIFERAAQEASRDSD